MKTNTKKAMLIIIVALFLFEISFLLGITDLQIWFKIGNENSVFANVMQFIGYLFTPNILIFSGLTVAYYHYSENQSAPKSKKFVYFGVACFVGGFIYSLYFYLKLPKWATILCLFLTCLLYYLAVFEIKKIPKGRLFQIYCVAVTAIVYCIAVLAIINLIKLFWGRIRPRDMQSISDFTRWYIPQGITGNSSFPSGHVANTCTLYIISMFAPIIKNKVIKALTYIVPIILIILMAFSRVLIGAHFASDTFFAILICIPLYYLAKAITVRLIARTLK